jgi:hypothetical protein
MRHPGLAGYLAAIALSSGLGLWLALTWTGAGGGGAALLAALGALAATEAGTAMVTLAMTRLIRPRLLPALDLAQGVPEELRTLVAVPVILTDEGDLARQLERLAVHHLSSTGGAMHCALLSDGPDAATEQTEADGPLIRAALAGIAALNASCPTGGGRPLSAAAPSAALEPGAALLDGMGTQARQADRAEPAAARRDRHHLSVLRWRTARACRHALCRHAGCRYAAAARQGTAEDRQDGASFEPAPL